MSDQPKFRKGDVVAFGHKVAKIVAVGDAGRMQVEFRDRATRNKVRRWVEADLIDLLTAVGATPPQPVIVEPPVDDEDTVEIPLALQKVIERRIKRVRTLVQDIQKPSAIAASDVELAQLLTAGWQVVSVSIVWRSDQLQRVVTLEKEDVVPVPQASEPPSQPQPRRQQVYVDMLADLPLARRIREEGAESVIEDMNRDAFERGLGAALYRLGQYRRVFTRHPGLPGRTDD